MGEFDCGARILRTNQSVGKLPIICEVQDHFYSPYLLILELYSTSTFMQLMTKILLMLS
jgi:hypothetical protein